MNYLSYLMGADKIKDQELIDLDIEIAGKTDTGSRKLSIPDESLESYTALIRDKMDDNYWNDIIGEDRIMFIFKDSGELKEYLLVDSNIEEIAALCSKLNGDSIEKTQNIYNYLAGNEFYSEAINEYYSSQLS